MKHILVIHTGGTISMNENPSTGTVSLGGINALLNENSFSSSTLQFTTKQPFHLPSPHITINEMVQLKEVIEIELERQKLDGVVITHGTDTLEETAFFLDITTNHHLPIVLTGAMRTLNEVGTDGMYNYISAIRVAASIDARDKGVLVVFNGEIHSARSVTKTHTSNVATFQSPEHGPLGLITKDRIIFHHQPLLTDYFPLQHRLNKRVALLKAYAGMEADLLGALIPLQYDGVVIEALGQGNLPLGSTNAIQALIRQSIPIVFVSRCFNGVVQPTYEYAGGGQTLKNMGVIFSNGLNGQKARIKLLIALSLHLDLKQIEEIFSR